MKKEVYFKKLDNRNEALRVIRANGKIDDFFSLIYAKVEVKTFQKQYIKICVVN